MPAPVLPEGKRRSWMRTVRKDDIVHEILSAATSMLADLIILSTQGHDRALDALRGNTTKRMVCAANCLVLAVPA